MTTPLPAAPRRGITLTQQIFIGLAIGIVAGWIVSPSHPEWAQSFRPFSQLFLRMIKMIIAPLIFSSLVAGIAGAGHVKVVGRMGLRAILYFEAVTTLALVIGVAGVHPAAPGRGPPPASRVPRDPRQGTGLGRDPPPPRADVDRAGDVQER